MQHFLRRLLGFGDPDAATDTEALRRTEHIVRYRLTLLYVLFGLVLTVAEIIINIVEDRPGLAFSISGMAVAMLVCLIIVRRHTRLAGTIGTGAILLGLSVGFYFTTKTGVTAYLFWGYVFIPVAFAIQGVRRAVVWVSCLVIIMAVLYLGRPGHYEVSGVVVRELTISYLAAFLLALVFETIRENYEDLLGRMNNRLEQLATTDQLTNAYNRRMMENLLRVELQRSKRRTRGFSVILFDLDHFKQVNDTHGHEAGDQVLQAVAELVRENVRPIDYFGRWGGEEFLILSGGAELDAAREIAERIRAALEAMDAGRAEQVTASFGVSSLSDGDDLDGLVRRADRALYEAKNAGRNRVITAR